MRSAPCCQTLIEASLFCSNCIVFVSIRDYLNDLTIGWQNLNPLSHHNPTLAPQARASGENLNYVTLAPQARASGENLNYVTLAPQAG